MRYLRCLTLVLALVGATLVQADLILAEASNDNIQNQLLQGGSAPRIGNSDAASRVKSQFPGNKILSVKLIQADGPAVYKVKLLSDDGLVRSVFVDGTNGEVFE